MNEIFETFSNNDFCLLQNKKIHFINCPEKLCMLETINVIIQQNSSKFHLFFQTDDDEDEDDVIQMPLRSYVESNEEMTESDCNVQEDDERTGTQIYIH